MPRFRRLPLIVEAEQWWPDHPVPGVLRLKADRPMGLIATSSAIQDVHLFVEPGDWIVTGVDDERYPVPDAVFRKVYEPVDGGSAA